MTFAPGRLLIAIPGVLVTAIGATVAAGWLLQRPAWLLPVQGSALMVLSTAVALVLAGSGVLAGAWEGRTARMTRHACGGLVMVLALLALAAHLAGADLGLDFPSLHAPLVQVATAPGRMAAPTALALLLTGLLLVTLDRPRGRLGALAVQLLATLLAALAGALLIAHEVAPEALLPGYRHGRVAAATAFALLLVAVGILGFIARADWYRTVYERRADEKVLLLTFNVFAVVLAVLGASAVALFQRNLEATVQRTLMQAVDDRAAILQSVIANRVTRASIVVSRPSLQAALGAGAARRDALAALEAEATSYLDAGFRGLAFHDEHGRRVAQAGVLASAPSLEVPLRLAPPARAALLWDEAFLLRVFQPVHREGRWVGSAMTEQDLELLAPLQFDVEALGRTAEWLLCAPSPPRHACFPQRFARQPRVVAGPAGGVLPMDRALAGERGFVNADDYRGERVIAAFAPVGSTGLGVVLKMDVDEFYAPLRAQVVQWGQWFLAIAMLAALLIASQVRPVVQRLVVSESVSRKRAEALARSERTLRDIYASLGDGIIVFAPDGTIDFANPAAERIFGYGPGELIGKPVATLLPERLREANAAATRRFLEGEVSDVVGRRGLVYPALRRDGRSVDIEFSLAEMREESRTRLVGVVRDVSERTALDRMKGEFIATVSHELRTPLTSIIGALAIVREAELPPAEREFLEMAWRNSERLSLLVNDIIDMERIESGVLDFHETSFALAPFLREAVQLNQAYATGRGAFLYLEEPLPEATLRADRDRLLQVMANLLSNAAKYSPSGEEIRIAAALADARVRIAVTDRGPGVPEEFRSKIFGKFAQADASDSRERGGSGLGLAICRAIVERSDGRIGFDSPPGEGTTFWFELPVAQGG